VEDFYHWAYGEVFTNIIRAAIAEYLVACALGLDHAKRSSWDGYDLALEGIRVEVKSSACFVSGKCPTKSNTYDIEPRANSWHPEWHADKCGWKRAKVCRRLRLRPPLVDRPGSRQYT
jgi:hypothetical protein